MKNEIKNEKTILSYNPNYISINHNTDTKYISDFQPRIWSSKQQLFHLLKIDAKKIDSNNRSVNYQHIKYKQDQKICLSGTPCSNLFVVYSGFLKTSWSDAYGNEKVLGFPMRGEILGLDGLNDYEYKNDVVAISDVELIIIPNKINNIHDPEDSHLVNKLLNIFSKELVNTQKIEYIIGSLPAEARVAKFLLSLGQKYAQLGYSDNSYNLKMTRNDIGSYLGLTLETVSRTLSEFNKAGIVTVDQKSIQINDLETLKRLRRTTPVRSRKLSA